MYQQILYCVCYCQWYLSIYYQHPSRVLLINFDGQEVVMTLNTYDEMILSFYNGNTFYIYNTNYMPCTHLENIYVADTTIFPLLLKCHNFFSICSAQWFVGDTNSLHSVNNTPVKSRTPSTTTKWCSTFIRNNWKKCFLVIYYDISFLIPPYSTNTITSSIFHRSVASPCFLINYTSEYISRKSISNGSATYIKCSGNIG